MATFISTTLNPFLITLPGTGETGREGRKMDLREEKVVEVK